MSTNETEDGIEITWKLPVVGKGERLEVSFEIKGEGEIDAEALNRFHGAHFGDELESAEEEVVEEAPAEEEVVEEAPAEEEVVEEAPAEEEVAEEAPAEEEVAEEPAIKFREDIMLRVMEEFGIEDRDAFLEHSMNFDLDDNGYLKKAEFVAAAEAFTAGEASEEESAEEVPSEDGGTEAEESSEPKSCPICSTSNDADAGTCSACGYTFE
jgi:hypothetical protein